jgi:lipoic acid synthetase
VPGPEAPPRKRVAIDPKVDETRVRLDALGLNTVCEESGCPNMAECYARGAATFLILGRICTRDCRFCAVVHGSPSVPDPGEPVRVARSVREAGMRYVVVTSVTRDDLSDGGAGHFARTIGALREECPGTGVEVLVPDFGGNGEAVATVVGASPRVFAHNVETVPRLYPKVRPGASYERSLGVLGAARGVAPGITVKSGLMVGLGEEPGEVGAVLAEMAGVGVTSVTIGQYLSPSPNHLPVERHHTEEEFAGYERMAREAGIAKVKSGYFVRSSYHASEGT